MDDIKIAKLKRFMADKEMNEAVHYVLLNTFLKRYDSKSDVNILAASRISLDMLSEAWDDLKRFKEVAQKEKNDLGNVGL